MSFRSFPALILIFLAFLYIAFFNPGNVTLTYAPGKEILIPHIAVIAISFFTGALCLAFLYLLHGFGGAISGIRLSYGKWRDRRLEGILQKARECAHRGEPEKALDLLEKLLAKTPEHFDALLLKGALLREAGDTKKAMAAHSLALSNMPSDRTAIMELKDDYVRAGYLSSAYKLLEQVRGFSADDKEVLAEMRDISEKMKDFKLAILLQKELARLAGDDNEAWEGRYRLAVLYCRHARVLTLDPVKGGDKVGGKSGDFKKAKKELSHAEKIYPGFLPAQIMQSEIAMKLGKTGQAESILRDLFIKTGSIITLRTLEKMYRATGRADDVETMYDWAVSTKPHEKILLLFLAKAKIEKSDFTGAGETLEGAAAELGTFAVYNLMIGLIQLGAAKGDGLEKAAQSFIYALDGEWSRFVTYRCSLCRNVEAEYFSECSNCRKWNTAKAVFPVDGNDKSQRLLKA